MLSPHPGSIPNRDSVMPHLVAAIGEAVSRLSPTSTVLALCFTANHNRVLTLQERLATLEADMEERRAKRNAAARWLVALSGRTKLRAETAENTVSFPVFQRTGTP